MAELADILKSWEDQDRATFVEYCQDLINKCPSQCPTFSDKEEGMNYVLYEICHKSMQGEIPVENAVASFSEIIHLHDELPSLICDILSILDTESQCSELPSYRDNYFNLLRYCCGKIIPEFTLKERLDFETLADAGIIKVLKNIQTKFIKTKTRLFYKQQKYNLYREEIEGYAKLITELDPDSSGEPNVKYTLEVIQSLIGCFNLDPNRVLDVILESFEHKPKMSDFFSQLLLSYFSTSETISQVVGFKFNFYQDDVKETPATLYRVTAFLLKSEIVTLNQLYGLLQPPDSKIIEEHKQEITNVQLYVKQLNTLSTNITENKESTVNEDTKAGIEDNQKLGVCAALLDVGDWKHARQLMNCFPDYYATSFPDIAGKLCNLMHVIIDNIYKKHNPFPVIKKSTKWELDSGVKCKSIETFNELFDDAFSMVIALGPYLHLDPVLMAKIIRLSRAWMLMKSNQPDYGIPVISNVIEQSLLPSLSLLECNCCMAEELWSLMKLFPYQARYRFYYQWRTTINSLHPMLIKVRADTLKKLKYIMKRLSKENVKPTGRQIGKLSHSNPSYIFDYILSQIQTWDNLILPVIDSLKYLTSLSYDVLAFCVIEALGNSEKDRMKHDGTSISLWLQSLASFGGSVFKKYPIDISGLLQHVANQLINEKSLDLLILKEVVQKMAGIEASEELTTEQLDAMTGGELLRSEGGYFNQMRNVKKSSQRLKEALLDQDLAIPLCLLMAQQRQCILYHEQENSHIKLVGKLYDQCQDTLVQYGSFLANSLSMEDYAKRLPPVSILLGEYNIQADVAFYLSRPALNHAISSKFEELRKQDKSMKNLNSPESTQKYLNIVDSLISPIVLSIRSNQLLKKTWEDLNPQVYVAFWSLSMYDLVVPSASYQREINKLKAILQSEENKDAGKKKKERERCDALISKLVEEEKQQQEHCQRVMARLKLEKENWFQTKAAKNETITQFLQLCLLPRCFFTPVDAVYCAKFVNLIHNLKTPNFSTLLCYDRVFLDITNVVACCTENEANRYGLFLCSMLETVSRWHSDKAIFDKECAHYPGFVTRFKLAAPNNDTALDHVDFENYRHVCHKWHFKLTKSLLKCLDSGEYVQIRNSLLVLRKIAPYFPAVTSLGLTLERRMENIKAKEKDKRPDIYVLATGYYGVLKSRKPFFVQESEFHLKENRLNAAALKKENLLRNSEKKELENLNEALNKSSKLEMKQELNKIKAASIEKTNMAQSNSQSSNKRLARSETDQNGVENNKVKTSKAKEEKGSPGNNSPLRKEDKIFVRNNEGDKIVVVKEKDDKRERRDEKYEKVAASSVDREGSDSARDSNAYRRSLEVETEREHKRRRTEGSSSRSPRDPGDRESQEKSNERNGRERSSLEPKVYKDAEMIMDKVKVKEKKATRKREYTEESSLESRRRRVKVDKDDEESKRVVEVDREVKREVRREDKSPVIYTNSDRRVEREDKKHHRSITGVKKR